eukprot:4701281-Pyramimonas_sp.AAC.1
MDFVEQRWALNIPIFWTAAGADDNVILWDGWNNLCNSLRMYATTHTVPNLFARYATYRDYGCSWVGGMVGKPKCCKHRAEYALAKSSARTTY